MSFIKMSFPHSGIFLLIILLVQQEVRMATNNGSEAEYLRNTINSLRVQQQNAQRVLLVSTSSKKTRRDRTRAGSGVAGRRRISSESALNKAELLAMYQSAVANGNVLKGTNPVALYHLDDGGADQSGPHYYSYSYYPLASFMDAANVTQTEPARNHISHHVSVAPIHALIETAGSSKKGKALSPLFMAISGFVGMAVMFMFSMILWPQLLHRRQRPKRTRRFFDPTASSFFHYQR